VIDHVEPIEHCQSTERRPPSQSEVLQAVRDWLAGALDAMVSRGVEPPVRHETADGCRHSVFLREGLRGWRGYGRTMAEAYSVALTEATRHEDYSPVSSCGCGRTYDDQAWSGLPLRADSWPIGGALLDLRHCECGSHISREVEPCP